MCGLNGGMTDKIIRVQIKSYELGNKLHKLASLFDDEEDTI